MGLQMDCLSFSTSSPFFVNTPQTVGCKDNLCGQLGRVLGSGGEEGVGLGGESGDTIVL